MGMLRSSSTEEDAMTLGVTVMQGIATGSLLYVVFFEIIEKERAAPQSSHHIQLVVIMLGSATIIALKVLEDVVSGESGPEPGSGGTEGVL